MISDDDVFSRACDKYRAEMARQRKPRFARWMLHAACYGFIGGFTAMMFVNWIAP